MIHQSEAEQAPVPGARRHEKMRGIYLVLLRAARGPERHIP